jgi:hypothetical protein
MRPMGQGAAAMTFTVVAHTRKQRIWGKNPLKRGLAQRGRGLTGGPHRHPRPTQQWCTEGELERAK